MAKHYLMLFIDGPELLFSKQAIAELLFISHNFYNIKENLKL